MNNLDQTIEYQTILSDSKLSVSDTGAQGVAEYRADELFDPNRWDYFSKKTDVYAIGIILKKMVCDLKISHELGEAIKIATDANIEGRASLKQLTLDPCKAYTG